MLYGIESGSLTPMPENERTETEHIEPEQMLDYLANHIKKLIDFDRHTEEIAPLLEIYFKESNRIR